MTIIGWSIVGIAFLWSMVFKDEIYDFFADIKKKRGSKRRGRLKDKLDASLAAQWMSARQVQGLIEENKELSNRLNLMHIENSKLQEENSKLVVLARGTLDVDHATGGNICGALSKEHQQK